MLLLVVIAGIHLTLGDMAIHWSDVLRQEPNLAQQIFWRLRMPRVLAAILVGASLGASGAVLQTLLHNPLAEPGLLGISSGASLTAVSVMVLSAMAGWQVPVWGITGAALVGALVVAVILFTLARRYTLNAGVLLLFGVVIGIIAGAGLTWLLYFSPTQNLRQLLYWMMGSLSFANTQVYRLWPLFLVVFALLLRDGAALNFILLGERYAFSLGIDVRKVRSRLVLWVALMSAIAVACAGSISFIGLLVPHLLRYWLGDEQRQLIWMSTLGGAIAVLGADILAMSLLNGAELPIGVITASVGGPLLFILLLRQHHVAH
ncbi:iron chelate uptake ABC transporter family permease subunit [Celerinatantimonas sp. YJH-8]|uniref:iron chelate uptake ABC transporter family permease subunit n=1 Tax=Celerinatantimonas sp. YJH-8 TaxID=3228714 RepID=UPI0038C75406